MADSPIQLAGRGGLDGRARGGLPLLTDTVCGSVTVSSSSVELKVGASRLTGRKRVLVQPVDGAVYVCPIPDETATTANSLLLAQGQLWEYFCPDGSEDLALNAIRDSADVSVRVVEMTG